ncbi:MAG: hypothetical protein QOI43_3058, partial [Gaiellales bacterium]|nr:hypothetical protein [Gaiellales bacterium]
FHACHGTPVFSAYHVFSHSYSVIDFRGKLYVEVR